MTNSKRPLADPARDGTVWARDLTEAPEATTPPGTRLFVVTAHDFAALDDAMHSTGLYPDDVVSSRLRDGRRPYAVETDGIIASFGWVALSAEPIGDLGISFQLQPDEAYIYDCATRPDYRGRGYYPALLRFMAADLHRIGRHRAWIGTAPGNVPSQRGILRAGFTKIADVHVNRGDSGTFTVDLYGVPGIPAELIDRVSQAFPGIAHPDTGIPPEL